MAQHDYVIDNSTGANVRADINSVLQAIATNNSGSSDPSTTYAFQFFADTTNNVMKIRNAANNAFIELFQLDGTFTLEDGSASTPALAFRDDLNTGIFSSAADNIDISTGGTTRVNVSSTGINVTGTVIDDGATHDGDVTFTGASANIVFDKSDNQLEFADNAKAEFGTHGDLEIFHDGSNSIINDAGTGQLQLQVGGSLKFNTQSGGVQFYGSLYADDNNKIELGNDQDLKIFHESNTNKIVSTASQFSIFTNGNLQIFNENGFANLADFIEGGACNLYFDAGKKFETSSTGTTTTGNGVVSGQVVAAAGFSQVDNAQSLISQSSIGSATTSYFIGNQQIQTSSDRRIKENIVDTEINALSKLQKVKVVDFNWNDPSDKAINNKNARGKWTGCIAQEIVDIFPHAVNAPRPEGKKIDYNSEDLWTIQYEHLVPVLIKAIQELSAKVAALEAA